MLAGGQELHGHVQSARVAGTHLADTGDVEEAQPLPSGHLLPVRGGVQRLDQLHVDDGVVGGAVVVEQGLLHLGRRGEVDVHRLRVEDPVGERAVVGGRVAVLREDRAHLRLGEGAVQIVHRLGGALPGAEHDGPAHRPSLGGELSRARQQLTGVPDVFGQLQTRWHVRFQAHGDADVAGPVRHGRVRIRGVTAGDLEEVHPAGGVAHRGDGDGLAAVGDQVGDARGGPLEVLVELHPQREQRLLVQEVDQSAAFAQEAQEAVVARRIAQGHQVLEERHLHRGVVDQHAPVPAEARLAFQEQGAQTAAGAGVRVVLLDCHGQGEI